MSKIHHAKNSRPEFVRFNLNIQKNVVLYFSLYGSMSKHMYMPTLIINATTRRNVFYILQGSCSFSIVLSYT